MRELFLLRHAKAMTESPTGDDFGRPLATRGQEAAVQIGGAMAERGWYPHRALVSSASRTRETWKLVASAIGDFAPAPYIEERLYNASAGAVLELLRETPDSVRTLVVVGHNPSMHELALRLCGDDSDTKALHHLRQKYPTAALARFEYHGSWETLNPHQPRLTDFLRPRDLAE